jgi:hypothetical protein
MRSRDIRATTAGLWCDRRAVARGQRGFDNRAVDRGRRARAAATSWR